MISPMEEAPRVHKQNQVRVPEGFEPHLDVLVLCKTSKVFVANSMPIVRSRRYKVVYVGSII